MSTLKSIDVLATCEDGSCYCVKGEYVDLMLCPYKKDTLVTFSLKVRNDSKAMELIRECLNADAEIS